MPSAFGRVASAKAKDEDSVYAQYYDYAEPLNKIPGHRVLALDRGEREGFLKVTIQVDAERAAGIVSWMFARKKTGGKSAELVDSTRVFWNVSNGCPRRLQPPHSSQP